MRTLDRGRRSKAGSVPAGDFGAASKGRLRRAVLDDARRKVERALATADAAEELASAAQAVLIAAEAKPIDVQPKGIPELRAALARYGQAAGGAVTG